MSKKDGAWTGWTFKIGTKAFKAIRPTAMSVEQELTREAVSTRWFFFTEYMEVPTGRWSITLVYDRGPHTRTRSEKIYFSDRFTAERWFNEIYDQVFTTQANHRVPPTPPKRKRPSTVKKKVSHLSIVKD